MPIAAIGRHVLALHAGDAGRCGPTASRRAAAGEDCAGDRYGDRRSQATAHWCYRDARRHGCSCGDGCGRYVPHQRSGRQEELAGVQLHRLPEEGGGGERCEAAERRARRGCLMAPR